MDFLGTFCLSAKKSPRLNVGFDFSVILTLSDIFLLVVK